MAKLEPINRMAYMNDMRILHEMILNLEKRVEFLEDRLSQYAVEQLDQNKDIKLPAKVNKTKKKTK